MTQSSETDVAGLIVERRNEFGEDFVEGRKRPEEQARTLLNASAGSMTREQAIRLGELLNEHTKVGVVRHDRFSPAKGSRTNGELRSMTRAGSAS